MENNIFKFVTKEISHDAFICWLVNWINIDKTDDNEDIKRLAEKFIEGIVEETKNEKVLKIINNRNYYVDIEKQYTMNYENSENKEKRKKKYKRS